MPKPYYLGLVTNHGNVEATGFDLQSQYAAWSHRDLYPDETQDLRKHWRVDRTLIHFDQEPTLEDFFRTMDWADRERVKLMKIKLGWHGREMPLSTFDPRQLQERHMPKVSRSARVLQEAVERPEWVDDERRSFRIGEFIVTGTNKEHARMAFADCTWSDAAREENYTKIKAGRWGVAGRPMRIKRALREGLGSLTMREVKLPLAEIGLVGPTRMEVQRRYNVHRATGSTIQGAIRKIEMELGISDVQVDAAGKDVVFFKNPDDSYTMHETKAEDDLVSQFLGMKISRCPKCNGLLAHRKGVALPCPTCTPKPIDEVWKSMTGVGDWAGANPGYDFRVIAQTPTGRQIIDRTPNLKVARQIAKNYYRQSKRRVEVLDAKSRRYFSLGC